MSGNFPTTPLPESMEIESSDPTFVSFSHSFQRRARSRGGQRWAFSFSYNFRERSSFAKIQSFLIKQRGRSETFSMQIPAHEVLGAVTTAGVVKGASQTGRTVVCSGWSANISGALKQGDFLQFAGHNKVYMVTSDVITDATGSANVDIEPALIESPGDGEVIRINNISFTVALLEDTIKIKVEPPVFYSAKFQVIEVPL